MRLILLLIVLSISLIAVNYRTNLNSQASESVCPTYHISPSGELTQKNLPASRRVQITINGSPMTNPPTLPIEGIYTWQVIDDHNCLSTGSYTPKSKITPNTNPNYPLLIPTLAK